MVDHTCDHKYHKYLINVRFHCHNTFSIHQYMVACLDVLLVPDLSACRVG